MMLQTALPEYDIDISDIILIHRDVYYPHSTYSGYSSGRKSYGFVYVISGNAEYISENERFTATKDSVIFLSSNTCYTVETRTDEPFHHYTVNFNIVPQKEKNGILYEYLSGDKILSITPKTPGLYESVFTKLLSVWKGKKSGFHLNAKSHLFNLTNEFFSEFVASQVNSHDYEKVMPAKKYIEENYTSTITNNMLANLCGISETHMRRLFGDVFKTSPIGYQIDLRMMKAKDLLLTGLYTVGETAEMCGFSDQNYFTRIFKNRVGVPPLKYKNSH
ncbi:MAG: AraC family transcriptional regulator [Ruminococcaceae bacterium]|nr:AraC family transcriptional regulator [Oscillospiraceae bacterium]